jgi:tetratricopeptide (TPR) repeat protein
MIEDAYGHSLSGATEAAVGAYDQAVRAFNLVDGNAVALFDAAREAAPDFAMAHLGKAWVFAVANDPGLMSEAKQLVETARSLVLNEREEAHLAALGHLVKGARAAAELEPTSFWPHHTVAHVMEMTGRPEDGLGWMAAREALWSTPNQLNQVHIWWHKALFHLELGQYDAALALYDGPIRATQRPVALSLTNATALLWRLDALGCDTGDRWRREADLWQGHADGKCLVFADIHAAMAELGSGQEALVERRLAAMRATAASSAEAAGLYRSVGIPVVEGLAAFHRGAYAAAVEWLLPVRIDLWQIGGSYAQRDVVNWTLAEAAARAGQRDVALSLAYERLATRPRSAPNRRFLREAEAIAA